MPAFYSWQNFGPLFCQGRIQPTATRAICAILPSFCPPWGQKDRLVAQWLPPVCIVDPYTNMRCGKMTQGRRPACWWRTLGSVRRSPKRAVPAAITHRELWTRPASDDWTAIKTGGYHVALSRVAKAVLFVCTD